MFSTQTPREQSASSEQRSSTSMVMLSKHEEVNARALSPLCFDAPFARDVMHDFFSAHQIHV
jgi:hypothetical protein